MTDKTCIVTGANAGIGKATARGLAERGAHVVMVCRNEERGAAAREEIIDDTGHEAVDLLLADLAVQNEIRTLADELLDRYDRIDVLINNAGIFVGRYAETPDGIEKTWAVNHLAYFLLTNLLLDHLKATAEAHGEARIINVGSDAHARTDGIHFDDPNLKSSFSGVEAYAQSKLANLLFTYELARRLRGTGVTVNCVHPGVVATNIWRGSHWLARIARLFSWFYKRPSEGAAGPLHLATSPEVQGVTGAYVKGTEQANSSRASYDETAAQRLWTLSAEMTGLAVGG